MEVKRYKKRPIIIFATQLTNNNARFIFDWIKDNNVDSVHILLQENSSDDVDELIEIETLEGKMVANIGDWIIRGVNKEFYPCKPDIFKKTYEEVAD